MVLGYLSWMDLDRYGLSNSVDLEQTVYRSSHEQSDLDLH